MLDQIARISGFIIGSFFHIWPYLLVTIPLAVAVQMSGASKYIKRAFQARPLIAILLATAVGAFSPFCSCGVIPVIASLLISGVPLAPVMSFWIASPSMDPEIFFLSVGLIGWKLAVWRLTATLVLSLGAGFLTHAMMERGWLGRQILRTRKVTTVPGTAELIKKGWKTLKHTIAGRKPSQSSIFPAAQSSGDALQFVSNLQPQVAMSSVPSSACAACSTTFSVPQYRLVTRQTNMASTTGESCCSHQVQTCGDGDASDTFRRRLFKETVSATMMVAKFMALAFLLEGLITLYVPQEWISGALGRQNPMVIILAALLGVPTYTTSLTALPMISGLLTQGMNPAAALAFLVAGPTTTLPAMAAVWPLVTHRVFACYISFALMGAVLIGYLFNLTSVVFG
jgi:uncharacterized membrane protein YraQ (UPF0718 family)